MSVDILGTCWDQCQSIVQYNLTSTETRRLVRTDSPGRPPRLSHSSWTMVAILGSTSTVINSVKQRLLRNRPGSALRPLATSCAEAKCLHSSKPALLNGTPLSKPVSLSSAPVTCRTVRLRGFNYLFFYLLKCNVMPLLTQWGIKTKRNNTKNKTKKEQTVNK